MRRFALVLQLVFVMLIVPASSAHASLWSGGCALIVTFHFNSPVTPAQLGSVSTPTYWISVEAAQDLDSNTAIAEPCVITLAGINLYRRTWVIADGSSTLWTCEATDAGGDWNQGWGVSPPAIFGSHLISGTWGAWNMVFHNHPTLNFVGTMALTVHPDDAGKRVDCQTSGITSLKMIGTMAFQDP